MDFWEEANNHWLWVGLSLNLMKETLRRWIFEINYSILLNLMTSDLSLPVLVQPAQCFAGNAQVGGDEVFGDDVV